MLSLKLGGVNAPGDGVALKKDDIGTVLVILQNSGSDGVDTYSFTKAQWDAIYNADKKNSAISNGVVASSTKKVDSNVTGFAAFYTIQTSAPYTCTKW